MFAKIRFGPLLAGWAEAFFITVLFILISFGLHDPLSMKSPFPWIWFAPVLIALHYGIWHAMFSLVLLVASYVYQYPQGLDVIHVQLFLLGGFLLTVICVIYNSVTKKSLNENNGISTYLQKRIQNTAYAYSILLLAYRRLEQSYITKPVTVRTSLNELKQLLAKSEPDAMKSVMERLLNILALNCSLEVAGIFPVTENKLGLEPIATIGVIKTPNPDDSLIKESLETGSITHVSSAEVLKGHLSNYLIVAPLLNQENKMYALLIVEEIPFLGLNEENLDTINLLLQYFTDGKIVKHAEQILQKFPDCPVDFVNELQRLMDLQKNTRNDSSAVAFQIFPGPHQMDYLFRLRQEIRGIDTFWALSKNDVKILIILMPLSFRTFIEGYRKRIDETLMREFKIKLNGNEIHFKSCQFSSFKNSIDLIEDLADIQ